MKVRVFSSPMCIWCTRVKQFLKDNNVKFEEIDVSKDREASMEMLVKTGQMGVPVIEVGDEYVIGFDQARLKKLLKLK